MTGRQNREEAENARLAHILMLAGFLAQFTIIIGTFVAFILMLKMIGVV